MRNIKAFPVTNVLPAAPQICLRASQGARGRRQEQRSHRCAGSSPPARGAAGGRGHRPTLVLRCGRSPARCAGSVKRLSLVFWEALPAPP